MKHQPFEKLGKAASNHALKPMYYKIDINIRHKPIEDNINFTI